MDINLTSHQQEIFDNILSVIQSKLSNVLRGTNIDDYLLSLTGSAGTGKTFLTTQISKYLKEKTDYSFTITAPTHKAVGVLANILKDNKIEANCKTIHSFLGIRPFKDFKTGEEVFTVDKTVKKKDTASLLIIDESSMISIKLYEYVLEAVEDGRVSLVLFIGDPYQLLPIDGSNPNIFNLQNSFKLTEIVRQAKDSYIIKLATKIRERIKNKNYINIKQFLQENQEEEITYFHNKDDFLNDFYKNNQWHKENKIVATHKNKDVDAFNRTIRNKYWSENGNSTPPTLLAGDMLRFSDTYSVKDITLYHNGQEIKLQSATLMYHETLQIDYWECQAINSPQQQIFRVVDPTSMKVFNDKLTFIANKAKKTGWPERKKLWFAFYQVRDMFANVQYIFSSTIHKLQGSTYDVSYIDMFSLAHNNYMSNDEKYRLLYVAVTRAKKDVKFFVSAFEENSTSIENKYTKIVDVRENHASIDNMLKEIVF